MNIQKIFKVLVVSVVCIMVGAFVLNKLVPNTTKQVTDAIEDSIYKATGLGLDLNGDGQRGQAHRGFSAPESNISGGTGSAGVEGFQSPNN